MCGFRISVEGGEYVLQRRPLWEQKVVLIVHAAPPKMARIDGLARIDPDVALPK